ncbi:MAG: choice-of-anchor Q domain-containing protein [Kiritimatiellia bacterium]
MRAKKSDLRKLHWLILILLFAAGLGPPPANAGLTNRYVVKDNSGAAIPYDSLANAAGDIQTAISYARAGETVLVAAATYDTGGVKYAGRYSTNRVCISNTITVRSLNNDPEHTIIKGAWHPGTTNGWLAVRCVYMVAGSSLVGFTLTNGATITTNDVDKNIVSQDACGGGVCPWGTTAVTVSNCIITGNSAFGDRAQSSKAGAGGCDGTYFNCAFIGNSVHAGGGGTDNAILSNCTLVGNSAVSSGGGAMRGTLYGCLVASNTASTGGGLAGWSAAWPCKAYDCTIITNRSASHGGGAIGGNNQYSVFLYNCTVAFNTAGGVGGGTYVACLLNCSVVSNRSVINLGGGTSSSMLTNCIVAYNVGNGSRESTKARNTLFYGNHGSAARVVNGDILENCAFVGNDYGISVEAAATVAVVNCISYSNTVNWTTYSTAGRILAFTNSCTFPVYPGWHSSNTTNNPLFVSFGSGRGLSHVAGNYRLEGHSPCVNSGMNDGWMANGFDLDGQPRIRYGTVDMGAYEAVFNGTVYKLR